MGKKLYVGNLSYSMTDDALSQLFAASGTVESAKVIIDNQSGRSKGFGFVEMSTNEEAEESISKFNDTEHDGRKIVVSEAKPMKKRENRGFGGNRGGRRSW